MDATAKIEPWPEPVDGEDLLDEIAALLRTDPTLTEDEVVVGTLYCVSTFFAGDNPKLKVDLDAIGCGILKTNPIIKKLSHPDAGL